jgi:carbon-monoxide dehydrogenase medium subunit
VEKALESGGDVQQAAAMVAEGVDANSDLHASAEYRTHLAVVHTARAILAALSRTA